MPRKVILDTDLGSDCDDAGAVALMLNLARRGECLPLAMTHCIGNHWGAYFIGAMQRYFKSPSVPIGILHDDGFLADAKQERYVRDYCEAVFGDKLPEYEDATRLLRRTLAGNKGAKDITFIAIGPMRNIARLFDSPPDDISPKTGLELVAEHVSKFYAMFGDFLRPQVPEYNVYVDIPSAVTVLEKCPAPIIYIGYELGNGLLTGDPFGELPQDHPCRVAYTLYNKFRNASGTLRKSWDPVTVYSAIRQDTLHWRISDPVTVRVLADGAVDVSPGGRDRYLIQASSNEVCKRELNGLMV